MSAQKNLFALSAFRGNNYDRELIAGVADYTTEHEDYRFELVESDRLIHAARRNDFAGIICRLTDNKQKQALRKAGMPVVDLLAGDLDEDFAAVLPDDYSIGKLAAEHFLERKFTNFAFFGYRGIPYSERRCEGFCNRLAESGFRPTIFEAPAHTHAFRIFEHLPGYDFALAPDVKQLARQLSKLPKPTAVFGCHDPRAVAVITACRTAGLRVPDDIAVLGTDNDQVCCTFTLPRISSIDPSARAIGYEAARRIVALASGEEQVSPGAITTIQPAGIVVRESTSIYPIDPHWLSDALIFIQKNATRGISAVDVFSTLKLSHTIVQSAFRKIRGTSVQQEIISVRMAQAEKMLKGTNISISEIARACGFASMRYFSQAFTKKHGYSPSDWRSNHLRQIGRPR